MAGKTSRKNGKKGGRPKGKKNAATLEKEAVLKEFRQKILKSAGVLFRSQIQIAQGVSYLYKTECTGRGKSRKCKYMKVTDPEEIENYLNGNYDDIERGSGENEAYYQIVVEKPDNKAIDSMLDRVFGKATQPIGGDPDKPLQIGLYELSDDELNKLADNA